MAPPVPSWQEALDPRLVRYLMRPIEQPGLISRTLGRSLIERVYAFAPATLGDELLQRWGNLLGEHGASVPIVHATPVPEDGLSYPTWVPSPHREQSPTSPLNATTTAHPTHPTPQRAETPPSLPHTPLAAPPLPDAPVPAGPSDSPETLPPIRGETRLPAPPRPVVSDVIQRKEMPSGGADTAPAAPLPLAPLAAAPMGGEGTRDPGSAPPPSEALSVRPVVHGVNVPPPPAGPVTLIVSALPVVRAIPPRAGSPTTPTPPRPTIEPHPVSPSPNRAESGALPTTRSEPETAPLLRPQPGTLPPPRSEPAAPPPLRFQPSAPPAADGERVWATLPQALTPPAVEVAEPGGSHLTPTPLRVVRETRRESPSPESRKRLVVLAMPSVAVTPDLPTPRWMVRERPAQPPAALPALAAGSPLLLGLPPTAQAALGTGSVPDTTRPPGASTPPPLLGAAPVVKGRVVSPSQLAAAPPSQPTGSATSTGTPASVPPASEPDMEQLSERVQRRLLDALAVERERRGEGRW